MPVAAPVILTPFEGNDFTTNVLKQKFVGTASPGSIQVYVNGSALNVTFSISDLTWEYEVDFLQDGINSFEFAAWDGFDFSPSVVQALTYYPAAANERSLSPPTGIFLRAYIDAIEIVVQEPLSTVPAMVPVGYNFYYSTETGLNFNKLNPLPIRAPSEIYKDVLEQITEALPDANTITYQQLSGNFTKKSVVSTEIYQEVGRYVYRHSINSAISLNTSKSAFYFITAIYYDEDLNLEYESGPSAELVGRAIVMDATIKGLPQRTRQDVVADYVNYVFETDPSIDLAPGGIVREIYIEPFANEIEKLRFLIDFYSRAQSFITLVQLDDADNDGISDPVASSVYKQRLRIALGVVSDGEVQQVIDEAFIKLSGNLNVPKLTSERATGFVTLRARTLRADVFVSRGAVFATVADSASGTAPLFYTSDVAGQMLKDQASSYYNASTGYFELSIPVTAQTSGSASNVSTNSITRIVSGVVGPVEVTNDAPIRYGFDEESNISLAERSLLAWVGVDSGTKGGYLFNSLKVGGVRSIKVVGGGDTLMVRDLIPIPESEFALSRGFGNVRHVWGTVDIYVQGSGTSIATETFSFANATLTAERFKVESNVLMQLATQNASVGVDTPIYEVTRVENLTRGGDYDLTGMIIIGGAVIDIDETIPANATLGICDTDVIRVDYSYRVSQDLVFSNQPMTEVLSIVGELSGDLTNNFNLYRRSHPLYEGMSTQASDYMRLFFAGGIPTGALQSSTDVVTLVEEFPAPLSKYGVVPSSIVVQNADLSATYERNVDYDVLPASTTDKRFRIRRIDTGDILNGEQVNVTYSHGENITVTYRYQSLPRRVADEIEETRHIDADVLVKSAISSDVNIAGTIIVRTGFTEDVVNNNVRNSLSRFFSLLEMGDPIHESDIIALIDDTLGVDFVLTPLSLLNRADNTLVLDELLPEVAWNLHTQDLVTSYITAAPVLQYKTLEKGARDVSIFNGSGIERRVVGIRDGHTICLQQDTEFDVSRAAGRSYIKSDGRVVVSTYDGVHPSEKELFATYYTYGEVGPRSIFPASNELLTPGAFNFRIITLAESKNG